MHHVGKVIVLSIVGVIIALIAGGYFLSQRARNLQSQKNEKALQEFNKKFEELNQKLQRNEPDAQEEMERLMEQYYGRPIH